MLSGLDRVQTACDRRMLPGQLMTTLQLTAVAPERPRVSRSCPCDEIVDLYHQLLPMGRPVKKTVWRGSQALTARWLENRNRQSLEWWGRFFARIAKSDFLTGRTWPRHGGRPFEIDLDWILAPSNIGRILQGKYD